MRQTIRIVKAADGVRLAWASVGKGPSLVKAANWLTHLEFDWDSPVWRHWTRFFAEHFQYIRYDERGCGCSDWDVGDLSVARWIEDLDAVIAAARPPEPFALLGVSQGASAAISFAIRHPERVSHLILYGAYSRGWARRADPVGIEHHEAVVKLTQLGWGQSNPVFRQLFTSRFVPDATPEQIGWFNELCRRTTTPEMATKLMRSRGQVDVKDLLSQVTVPTLVLHARHDEAVPFDEARVLASEIPNARLLPLESRNHILLESEPAWARFKEEVLGFVGLGGVESGEENGIFATLSSRERQILVHMIQGQSNAAIGKRLFISDKTVRNHVTRIYEKLGVTSRAQAIVLAKDKGLRLEEDNPLRLR